jgi:hypothetical protein
MFFGGDVRTVLESPRAVMPPKTPEEALNQPGRREQIEQLTKRIESEGIKYIFFQQVSVTGGVVGKGVVASFSPQVAEKGYQLVLPRHRGCTGCKTAAIGCATSSQRANRRECAGRCCRATG